MSDIVTTAAVAAALKSSKVQAAMWASGHDGDLMAAPLIKALAEQGYMVARLVQCPTCMAIDGHADNCPERDPPDVGEVSKSVLAADIQRFRDALLHICEYWNGAATESAMLDALNHIVAEADAALRATRTEST